MTLEIGQRFLLVPLYLLAWPVELYGDWLVIQAAAMLLPLADLGIMPYFSNAMAMAWARGDRPAFDRLLGVAFGLYALLLAVAVPAYALAVLLIARAGGFGDGAMSGEARALVWLFLGLYHWSTILVVPGPKLRHRGDSLRHQPCGRARPARSAWGERSAAPGYGRCAVGGIDGAAGPVPAAGCGPAVLVAHRRAHHCAGRCGAAD